jgi:hypothetical protein
LAGGAAASIQGIGTENDLASADLIEHGHLPRCSKGQKHRNPLG